jgi:hypothetical protein
MQKIRIESTDSRHARIDQNIAVVEHIHSRPGSGRSCRISRSQAAGSGMTSQSPPAARRDSSMALRLAIISGDARGTRCFRGDGALSLTELSVAETCTFAPRSSFGRGRCTVPSAFGSRIELTVLMKLYYRLTPKRQVSALRRNLAPVIAARA